MAALDAGGSLLGSSREHTKPSPPLLLISAPASEPSTTTQALPESSNPRSSSSVTVRDPKKRDTLSKDAVGHATVFGSAATQPLPSRYSSAASIQPPASSRLSFGGYIRPKRPPASRCSNGVETACGPPPASITRVPWRGDTNWAFPKSSDQIGQQNSAQPESSRLRANSRSSARSLSVAQSEGERERSRVRPRVTMSSEEPHSPRSPHDADDIYYDAEQVSAHDPIKDFEKSGDEASAAHRRIKSGPGRQEDIMQNTNEDLFLNLAQDATPQQTRPRASSRTDRYQDLQRSQDEQSQAEEGYQRRTDSRASQYGERPKTADGKSGDRSSRLFGLSSRSTYSTSQNGPNSEIPIYRKRRPSITSSIQSLSQRHPQYRSSRLGQSPINDPNRFLVKTSPTETSQNDVRPSLPDGTDSVNSNTAPSTVWDELDELKSRIKKLELTGKLPATSGQAISNGSVERPRTATTTVTTISSSPNHRKAAAVSPTTRAQEDDSKGTNVHPLLHSALARAKQVLSPSTYRVLEATAFDALALATMTGNVGLQGTNSSAASIINGAAAPDRQIRRKADSMCRSLTELCIALCESKSVISPTSPASTIATRPASRDTTTNVGATNIDSRLPRERQSSLEPERAPPPRNSPSRALSRIEARRSSLITTTSLSASNSPREITTPRTSTFNTPPSSHQISSEPLPNRFTRTGTSLLRDRRRRIAPSESPPTTSDNNDDEGNDFPDDDPTLRVPSRAATELVPRSSASISGSSTLQRFRNRLSSREYTSSHPLPNTPISPLSPTAPFNSSTTTPPALTTAGTTLASHLASRRASGPASSPLAAASAADPARKAALPLRGSGRRYGDAASTAGDASVSGGASLTTGLAGTGVGSTRWQQRLSGQFGGGARPSGEATNGAGGGMGRMRSIGRRGAGD
ncbi:MAG: hypothetical protein M1822_006366 [Bathelium mastoideum]|nr:MAG: hypothetical protein M1822_006366 [Bathelium mastoideum]